MSKVCYADVISWFDVLKSQAASKSSKDYECEPELKDENKVDVDDNIVNDHDGNRNAADAEVGHLHEFRDSVIMRKRKKQRVLWYIKSARIQMKSNIDNAW